MSIQNVRAAIERFLASDKEEVLCIRGAWGTGKTYNWKTITRDLRDKPNAIALNEYAYVSLFGLNSIAEVKTQILQSMVVKAQIGDTPDLTTFSNVLSTAESGIKKGIIKSVTSVLGSRGEAIVSAMGFLTSRIIVCLDDFERKGNKLSNADVLGLITYLKEERKCKVALLLNDNQLCDRQTFDSYLEKAVDINLKFEPSVQEIGSIAITDNDPVAAMVRADAETLGIDNVRVIQKILSLVRHVEPMLEKYHQAVTVNAVAVITLYGWSHLQPELAPPLEYLKRMNAYSSHKGDEDMELRWRDLLMKFNYAYATDFFLVLLKGVQNGYFDQAEIDRFAPELARTDALSRVEKELSDLWAEYHYSFATPQKELLDKMFDFFNRYADVVSISDIVAIVRLFQDFSDLRWDEILDTYITVNAADPQAFSIERLELGGSEVPREIKERISKALAAQKPSLSTNELIRCLHLNGFDSEYYERASQLDIEDYERFMRTESREEIRNLISAFRQYLRTGGLQPAQHIIMDKAGDALRNIAKDSEINMRRAMKTGLIQRLEAKEGMQSSLAATKSDTTIPSPAKEDSKGEQIAE
ncbi:hypothetical protein [Agrobacterium rubi]|uniref:KAP NTPase domain-containing protein n=1 Tax=Agrobacterium rubi TaxID=28099 RepID=A0AAE7UNT1_9HYPH|nr:hypothetical protein [Agrobacterium rubi]NTE89267.1 hypothetical protein [Agrobacterium rubi]NTF05049.1 hypothetical protein [Agrobacterium rubi]NTF38819.1 hypothetical protein [Agrobacterium rubi]OCJ43142.1 hypothetical protein A6U92_20180 [Agrobacterium rubi]QTF99858.1 hypothetical protein G6M88_05350 [Agrobacterium rubi]